MNYGYIRVSTKEQNEDRQFIALLKQGIKKKNIFVDKVSGKDFKRPAYNKLIKKLKKGDVVFIKSIDRLGRNYTKIIEQWRLITKDKKADIVVIDMTLLDTRNENNLIGTFISDIVLQILSFVAENERTNIRQRQAEGIELAKEKGVKFGRPKKEIPDNFNEIVKQWKDGLINAKQAAKLCNMGQTTFYRKIKNLEN